jgi:hypothetical protein
MRPADDNGRIYVSGGILRDGTFGAFLVPDANPSVEYYLIGGFASPGDARAEIQARLSSVGTTVLSPGTTLELLERERPPIQIGGGLQTMTVDELKDVVSSHLKRSLEAISGSKLRKALMSHRNLIGILMIVAAWMFWTERPITVPKSADLPFVGDRLAGIRITPANLGRYLPLALCALYAAVFVQVRKASLEYDLTRRHILLLAIQHGWRFPDFARLLQTQWSKSHLGWLTNLLDSVLETDAASITALRARAASAAGGGAARPASAALSEASKPSIPATVGQELDEKLAVWFRNDFERRIHNMYYIDREEDYGRSVMSFDPLIYLLATNRVAFRAYSLLRARGVPLSLFAAPMDPDRVERMRVPMYWVGEALRYLIVGGVLVWSFLVSGAQVTYLFVANVIATGLVLGIPSRWNYLALIRKRGFPKWESLGAYTVSALGPSHPNRLLLL